MLVQACLNGSRRRDDHPAVPVSHPELALDAHHAVLAGAGALHVHPRQADGTETLESGACALALSAIRRVVPGTPVGVTTAAWIEPDPDRRRWAVERWEVPPDFASVNLSEDGWQTVAEALLDRGVGVEAGLDSLDLVEALAGSGLAERFVRLLVEIPEEEADPVAAAAAIDEALDGASIVTPRLHHGEGRATWAVLEAAARRGRDIRVGLEDTVVLADGRRARDNAELVRAAVALAGVART